MPVLEKLIGLLAPHLCIGCGKEGEVLCAWCYPDAAPALPSRCYRCHALSRSSRVCGSCRSSSRLRSVWVRTEYDGIAKLLVHDFKFARKRAAYLPIAHLMEEVLPVLPGDTIVTHAPTATSRERQRGYDQSLLLAKQLARARNLKFSPLLIRSGQTRQVGSDRNARLKQLESSYSVRNKSLVKGKSILVVDDMVTTGATLETVAAQLRSAGAKHVDCLVFAQKL